jgi:hypothetical protein
MKLQPETIALLDANIDAEAARIVEATASDAGRAAFADMWARTRNRMVANEARHEVYVAAGGTEPRYY